MRTLAEVGALRINLSLNSVDFTQGMQNINRRLTALNSEFRAITSGAARFDNSLEALRSRSDVLTRSMTTHRVKVEELRRQYEQSKATKGEDAAETIQLATAYNRAVTAMNRTEQQLRNVNRQIQEQSNGFNQLQAQVNASVDSISRQMRVLETGFAAATAGIDNFGQSTAELQQREQHLNQTLNLHQQRVQELTRLHQESARVKGNDAAETQELEIRLNRATQQMRETQAQLDRTTNEIQQQSNAWNRLQQNMSQTGARLQSVGGQMQSVGSDISQSFGAAFLVVSAGLGLSAKKAMDFEQQMSSVYSVMSPDEVRAFGNELEVLAITMGEKTKYSGIEAAQGIEELIKAGVQVTDIINGGLDGALSLATAGELELADAAEIASTALNAFKADNLSVMRAADLLAGAANASATSVGELKFGLAAVSAVASGVGLSFEETTTALASFAQNGLKGSDAGTSLKTMLLRLSPTTNSASEAFDQLGLSAYNTAAGYKYLVEKGMKPTGRSVADIEEALHKLSAQELGFSASKKDLNKRYEENAKASGLLSSAFYNERGEIKSLAEIAELLKTKMAHLNDEQRQNYFNTMFGTDAIRAANILYKEGAKGVTDMATAMNKIKSADVAAQKLDNVKGRIEELSGAVETATISLGNALLPTIDKAVAFLQKMTDKFNSLSPAMQENIVNAALVAAGVTGVVTAIGVGLTVVGAAVTGFGALTTGLGLAAGAATLLTGPVGLVVAGVGLATAAVLAFKDSNEEAIEVNLEHAQSLIEQQQSLEDLTMKYEALRDKNKLTNDELLLFRDIQADLKTSTTAKEIEKLTAEANRLQEKSGLTNEEFTEMLRLNDELIEKVPTAGQAFSEQGQAILKNTDDLHEANNALRDNIALELELQKTKLEAKLDDNIRKQIEATDELNKKIRELNNAKIEGAAKEFQLGEMRKKQQEAYKAGQDAFAKSLDHEITLLEHQVNQQNEKVGAVASEVQEKQKSLEKTNEEIVKTQELYNEMINLQLAQAGINAKGAEGIAQLDSAIKKTNERISELNKAKEAQGGLNGEQQKELDNLNKALGMYRNTKGEIQGLQTEQGLVNQKIDEGTRKSRDMSNILSKSEVKDIKFTGDGYREAKIITDEAKSDVKKEILVTDYGKTHAIQQEAEKPATKKVTLKAIWDGAKNVLQAIIPGFATGTRNAPGGLSLVGEQGPELVHLPQGAKVIPNHDTEAILRNWNIPMLEKGGVALTKGMAYVGEKGKELMDMTGAIASPLGSNPSNQPYSFTIQPAPIILDGVEIGQVDFDLFEDRLGSRTNHRMVINGVRR